MSRDSSGQAFPFGTATQFSRGMTIRDYFAGQVVSMLAEKEIDSTFGKGEPGTLGWEKDIAQLAYRLADAMVKAREGK